MTLRDLMSALPQYAKINIANDFLLKDVSGVASDSRLVKPGNLFVAIRGLQADGHDAIPQAIANGAQYLVVEDLQKVPAEFSGFCQLVANSRIALDLLASRFFMDPSKRLLMFGVTGTNGKTSTIYMFEHILQFCGIPTGVIGTIDHHFKDQVWQTQNTTPGAIELQERLKQMRESGAKAVAMEVTSHALAQHRVGSVHFNTVLFTNLTQDHLDYHKNMQEYFLAKQTLFTNLLLNSVKVPVFAIVNTDDEYGRKLRVSGHAGIWSYGQKKSADFYFQVVKRNFSKTEYLLRSPFGQHHVVIPLCGMHNVYNTVGVIAAAASVGIPINYSLRALSTFPGVPGRMQPVTNSKHIHVYVDYAHTPDALKNVLLSIQEVKNECHQGNRIITVFGCGGERDRSKRPLMAEIAEQYSDDLIITSDNPRSENPLEIISDILSGLKGTKHVVEVDRRKAIEHALQIARAEDIVLIAGKGHETYQIIGKDKTKFSDLEVATEILQ